MLCEPAQLRVSHAEDGLTFINDRPPSDKRKSARLRIGAESNPGWSNCRKRFRGIDDRDILLGLIFENAQLRRAIFRDRAITIEVVGSEVQPDADRRPECPDGFELERAHFNCQHIERLFFQRDFTKRLADVAAGDRALAAGIQHLRQQLCRGRFSVRAGNRDDRDVHRSANPTRVHRSFQFRARKNCRQRRNRIDARTQDHKIVQETNPGPPRNRNDTHAVCPQIIDRRFQQIIFVGAVEHGDLGALLTRAEAPRRVPLSPLQAPQRFGLGTSVLPQFERGQPEQRK